MYSQITVRGQAIYLYHHKLYAARTEMRKEAIWRQRMQQNPLAAGAPPRTQLGSLQHPRPIAGGEGRAGCQWLKWGGAQPACSDLSPCN